MEIIRRRSHPVVRRFLELKRREARDARGQFLVEGVKTVREALSSGLFPEETLISPRLGRNAAGRGLLAELAGKVHSATDEIVAFAGAVESHQGVLAILPIRRHMLANVADPVISPFLLLAVGVQDPGNLGALVRIAEGFGAGGLIVAGGADPWGPKCVRAAAGSSFRLPLIEATDLPDALSWLRGRGYRTVAAVPNGGMEPSAAMRPPLALLLGSEGGGLDSAILALVDDRVTIPLARPIESLNVATAAAILAYDFGERCKN